MKRLISILVIATMLFASVLAMVPASAESEIPAIPRAEYSVNWKDLIDNKLMQAQYEDEIKGTGEAAITYYDSEFDFVATATEFSSTASNNSETSFFSTKMFDISEDTYYEYVVSVENVKPSGYCGPIFAYYDDAPYFAYGSLVNAQDSVPDGGPLRGDSRIGVMYETYGDGKRPAGTDYSYLKLALDDDGYGTVKFVYDGYDVSIYGLTAEDTWTEWANTSFTLPEGSKVAFGVFNRKDGRIANVKNAVLTAGNYYTTSLMNGDGEAKTGLAFIMDGVAEAGLIATDYTEASYNAFLEAVIDAMNVYAATDATDADYTAAITALDNAVGGLVPLAPDYTELVGFIATLKAQQKLCDTLNPVELEAWLTEANALLEDETTLNSEIESHVKKLQSEIMVSPTPINSAEDFAAMEADGNYILNADITITNAYGTFKGFFNGNGHTITLNGAKGVFGTLDGAVVNNLVIDGAITHDDSVGALATDAQNEIYVINVENNASVTVNVSKKNVAGFIAQGKGTDLTFVNCANRADIIGGRTAGFVANNNSGASNYAFYGCINEGKIACGAGVSTNPAAGFLARATDGDTETIVFMYCANYGVKDEGNDAISIASMYSAGAFFGCGRGDVTIYGCYNDANISANDNASHMRPIGGFVGGGNENDGAYDVTIEASAQMGNVIALNNKDNNPVALLVGGTNGGTVTVKDTFVEGIAACQKNNVYKITGNDAAKTVIENVIVEGKLNLLTYTPNQDNTFTPVYTDENPNAVDKTPDTDQNAYTEESVMEFGNDAMIFFTAIMGDNLEFKQETAENFASGLRGLVLLTEAAMEEAREALVDQIGDMKDEELYTEESYDEYCQAIGAIYAAIGDAEDEAALATIKVADLVAAAEAKLVTLEAAAAKELADAKADALVILSAKRENAGNVFTAASYTEYASAFDAIVASINGAADMAALDAIDIAALKVAAEAKLVVDVPAAPEADDKDEDDKETEKKDDEEDKKDETEKPAESGCGGCGSSAAISAIAVVAVIGTGVALKKKKD